MSKKKSVKKASKLLLARKRERKLEQKQKSSMKKNHRHWTPAIHLFGLACLTALLVALFIVFASLNIINQGKVLANVWAWGVPLEGLSKPELLIKLKQLAAEQANKSFVLTTGYRSLSLTVAELGIELDPAALAEAVYGVGREGDFWRNQLALLSSSWQRRHLETGVRVDQEILVMAISSSFNDIYPVQNASLEKQQDGSFIVIPSSSGLLPDLDRLSAELIAAAQEGIITSLVLDTSVIQPEIDTAKAEQALVLINSLQAQPVTIKHGSKTWQLSFKKHADLIQITKKFNHWQEPYLSVSLLEDKVRQFLKEEILAAIEIETRDVVLKKNEEGNLIIEGIGVDGIEVDLAAAFAQLYKEVPQGRRTIALISQTAVAKVITEGIEDNLGIEQLIAVGESDFRNSPANRIHNIQVSMARFNNAIIAPGEIFSFGKQLGLVDGSTGYKKELVIKEGGNTIPEYGGGICQVSSTAFRAAINAGLPINQRRPHSYAVVYYNPPGLDATVYPPSVDLQFTNDTPGHIIMQTRVDMPKHKAYFYFYGTADGRKVELSTTGKYDLVSIDEPVYELTDDLPPGVKKLKPHAELKVGYKVSWKREISFANGEIRQDKFFSQYRAFPPYYLLGKQSIAGQEFSTF